MSNNAASNVLAIRDRELDRSVPGQQAAQFERLLRECQEIVVERLSQSVSAMLEKADDALWQLANQAQERELREAYMATKDKVAGARRRIESEFRANYLSEFYSRARRDKKRGAQFSQYDLTAPELGLLSDDDLEETLKQTEMATKLRLYCDEELAALDQRVAVLVGDANLRGDDNPFSPQAICAAFKATCHNFEASMKARMALLKLFDEHVLDDIRSIYRDLNGMLVERSILPRIRYGMPRGAGAGAIARSGAAALAAGLAASGDAGAATLQTAVAAEAAATGEPDMFAVLQRLMTVERAVTGISAGPAAARVHREAAPPAPTSGFPPIEDAATPAAPAQAPHAAELLKSLTRIQHGDVSVVAGGNLPLAATLVDPGTTNVLHELKATSFGSGLGQIDGLTLDIVALLFDQIFGDDRIPPLMKGLIGRLQIPMLKVAILDKTFFSKKTHPARRLLDTLGEIGLGLNAEFDTTTPLYKHIDTVVQKLVDGFQESMDLFDELREQIEQFIADEAQRAEEQASRVAKHIEYKEKLEHAKAVAQQEILQRAKSGTLPRAVLKFLADHWLKLMLMTHAKHGSESEAWKSALETMDLLAWSVNAKRTMDERRKLATMLPGLLKRLNAGLQMIGAEEGARKRFFAKLMRCHTKALNAATTTAATAGAQPALGAQPPVLTEAIDTRGAAAASASAVPVLSDAVDLQGAGRLDTFGQKQEQALLTPAPVDDDTEPTAVPPEFAAVTIQVPFGEGDVEIEEIQLSALPPGSAGPLEDEVADTDQGGDEYSRKATRLKVGMWVEFRNDDDIRRQARLSFISPLKGTYLFVNRQGKKVGEYSLYQLAREFRTGQASILEAVPLFDRAMGSLVGALRTTATTH